MTPERFRQIRNLFEAALERNPTARSSFLAEACQGDKSLREEVERLLLAHDRITPLPLEVSKPEMLTGEVDKMEGRRIDRYEILRELGRGGMGAVYLAVRTDDVYRKRVAFKVVRPEAGGHEVIERFRQEREILSSLDHPNLAHLLDGGTTPEGLPYFVMDYIEGQPIDAYCDEHQLDIAQRLQLFRSVCAAVEYAHGHGVVHRDLKPSNVLVTKDGVVKLLDFGIAKMVRTKGSETTEFVVTRAGMQLMTPEYASPEQVSGEAVGTASDIYSLGVILFELLTGHRPYRMRSRMIHEIVRVICEEEPTRPSTAVTEVEERQAPGDDKPVAVTPQSVSRSRGDTPAGLRRRLSGDPDRIILKALRKDPLQRYRTAQAFEEDVRRHLEGLPVAARGESFGYRMWKFAWRYRYGVLAGAVLAVGQMSGAVKLSPLALGFLFLFCSLLLYRYREMAERVGQDLASKWLFWIVGGAAILSALVIAIVKPEWNSNIDAGTRDLTIRHIVLHNVSVLGMGVMIAGMGANLARWWLRGRWAGPLLMNISQRRGILTTTLAVQLSAVLCAGCIAFVLGFGHMLEIEDVFQLLMFTVSFSLIISTLVLKGRAEIRRHGLISPLLSIRWSQIEGYVWERHGQRCSLNVRMRGKKIIFRGHSREIAVPVQQMPAVEAILQNLIAKWPG